MNYQLIFFLSFYIFQINSQRCNCGNRNYNPVCGANGKTYFHRCMMRCDEVEESYQGVCIGCNCPDVLLPVCGDDGFSYINSCEANCHQAVVVRSSMCPNNCNCQNEQENRVCGINKKTYRNLCQLRCNGIKLLHKNACNQNQGCNCNRGHIDPICSINGILYQNACFARCNHIIVDPQARCLEGTRFGNINDNKYWHYHQEQFIFLQILYIINSLYNRNTILLNNNNLTLYSIGLS